MCFHFMSFFIIFGRGRTRAESSEYKLTWLILDCMSFLISNLMEEIKALIQEPLAQTPKPSIGLD